MAVGTVFNVQRFSVRDGPGIRTTVFFKGCPLRCPHCHNPESQEFGYEVLRRPERGTLCEACFERAAAGVLTGDTSPEHLVALATELCPECGEALLAGAVERVGWQIGDRELLDQIARDRVFFERSGGGVTFSGGEPLGQPRFLLAVLEGCRERGLHACLDTCGQAPWQIVERVSALTDSILYDLKAVTPETHQALTGVHPGTIIENLRRLVGAGADVIVRVPLVPGWNDAPRELAAMATIIAALDPIPPVDILPFHRYGCDKYERLGRPYPLGELAPAPPSEVERAAEALRSHGLIVSVRGEPPCP
jgi:pyruvate formate lyase activating enzyme